VGPAASGVSHAQFTPDGRHALVSRDGDFMVSVLRVEGENVTLAGRDITVGIRPYGFGITRDGRWAAVANLGRVSGDADTVSLVSLAAEPFRVTDTISVGPTPEGIQVSPDNRHVAVVVINGSARATNHPLYGRGKLVMLRIEDGRLVRVAEAEMGSWGQGVAFNGDGTRVYVQNMIEREIQGFGFDGQRLTPLPGRVAVDGGPSALRTAER
jgi:DNA-binding beta-propeller fold protein YncE